MNNQPLYLTYQFEDTPDMVSAFDELPLWSAPFGLLLLKHISFSKGMKVVDAGPGTGFPLLELAARLGDTCKVYGIDPWLNALERAKQKCATYGLGNVEIIAGSAAKMPFEDGCIDLIVSNLGINNFEEPEQVFKECHRVLRSGGKIALTTNLNGHWQLFYDVFEASLFDLHLDSLVAPLKDHVVHRGTVETIRQLSENSGFQVCRSVKEAFQMRFLDGTSFLNHHFIKLGWLASWKSLVPESLWALVFSAIEERLNAHAAHFGELLLDVPMAYIEAESV